MRHQLAAVCGTAAAGFFLLTEFSYARFPWMSIHSAGALTIASEVANHSPVCFAGIVLGFSYWQRIVLDYLRLAPLYQTALWSLDVIGHLRAGRIRAA